LADPDANIIFGTVIDESMKETVKVTVIATGFDSPVERKVAPAEDTPAPRPAVARKAQPPFPVVPETPPYVFEPKSSGAPPIWEPSSYADKQWETYETPSFIRRTKHSSMRKSPHEIS
jgi:cell division protein FtsZ